MKIPVIMPVSVTAKNIPGLECLGIGDTVDLGLEPVYITWLKKEGEEVKEGEVLLEGEVQKRIVSLGSPCSGILDEIIVDDSWSCEAGEILGYIENGE